MLKNVVIWMLTLAAAGTAYGRSPNVIVFYTDDLGNGDVSCFGATDIRTPNIDALAESGVRLTNYYSAAPVCSPSRAAMLTGRTPRRCGMSTSRNIPDLPGEPGMDTEETTFAELAQEKGYATALFGKWHLGDSYETQPNAQGFDEFFGHHCSCIDSFSHMHYVNPPFFHDLYRNRTEVFEDGVHMTDLITRETKRFINDNADKPFLIYVSYNTPHYPMVAKKEWLERFEHLPRLRQVHAALVWGIDQSVGEIMGTLSDKGLTDDTLVFFASDNGAANLSPRGEGGGSNVPYREYKQSLFDGGTHLPGIVSWPGTIPAGESRDQLCIAMDIYSTIVDTIGAKPPSYRTIDGKSWMPFLKDPSKQGHDMLFFEWSGQHAIRYGKWKIIENGIFNQHIDRGNRPAPNDPNYIYVADTKADPSEAKNLYPQQKEMADHLLELHADWRREVAQDPTASPPFDGPQNVRR